MKLELYVHNPGLRLWLREAALPLPTEDLQKFQIARKKIVFRDRAFGHLLQEIMAFIDAHQQRSCPPSLLAAAIRTVIVAATSKAGLTSCSENIDELSEEPESLADSPEFDDEQSRARLREAYRQAGWIFSGLAHAQDLTGVGPMLGHALYTELQQPRS